jgi:hypothetical protein
MGNISIKKINKNEDKPMKHVKKLKTYPIKYVKSDIKATSS